MTAAEWAILIPSLAGFLTAAAALMHSIATRKQVKLQLGLTSKTTSAARRVQLSRSDLP